MMLAGSVLEHNLPAKAATFFPWKIDKSSSFETDIYCMHSGSIGHLRLKLQASDADSKRIYQKIWTNEL